MSVLAAYRGLLGNRPLVRLFGGEFVSGIGDWLYLVALLIVVYQRSDSPALLGAVGAARVLPYILLSVPAGIAADRFDRRLILMVTDLARGVIMVGLAWLVLVDGPLEAIVALALLATCFSSFFRPALGALVPSLVEDERQLGPANSAWSSLDNLAFIIGPAIAGILIQVGGLPLAFALNAVSFGVVAFVLWQLPRAAPRPAAEPAPAAVPAPTEARDPTPSLSSFAGRLSGLVLVDIVASFVFGGLGVLTVIVAVDVLGSGEEATGYLNAAIGVGGLIGAVASGALVLRSRLAVPYLAGAVALGIGLAILGASSILVLALAGMAVAAFGELVIEVVSATIFQRVVPDALRGRVLGVTQTLGVTAYAAGSFVLPLVAGIADTGPVLIGSGVAVVAAAVAGTALLGRAGSAPVAADPEAPRFVALSILAGLPPSRLETAAARLVPVGVSAGETIVRQGDRADRFYFIDRGSFAVTEEAGSGEPPRFLRELGPDGFFGEIGLLTGRPRSATVAATTDGRLLALDGAAFLELVGPGSALGARFLDLYRGPYQPVSGSA